MSGVFSAPAKLNLMLHIVGRRADGYHELQTVFQLIDLCDQLEIRSRDDGLIRRIAGPAGVAEDADLTVRAARALQAATGTRLGADITIRKRIPMGGGLGGGSSDAATTLVALNQIWQTGLEFASRSRQLAPRWARMCRFSCMGGPPGRRGSAKSSLRCPCSRPPGSS